MIRIAYLLFLFLFAARLAQLTGKGTCLGGGELLQDVYGTQSASAPTVDANAGWTFTGWETDFSFITSDVTETAQELPVHTVTFDLGLHGQLKSGMLSKEAVQGSSVVPPVISVADGWRFAGWNYGLSSIQQSMTVDAQYATEELSGVRESKFFKANSSTSYPSLRFGASVSISGDRAIVGAPGYSPWQENWGRVYTFERKDGLWIEGNPFVASGIEKSSSVDTEGFFGRSVALYGDTAVVGALNNGGFKGDYGHVFVYSRQNADWIEEIKIKGGAPGDDFGACVGIDKDTLVAGAPGRDKDGIYSIGSVGIYHIVDGAWVFQDEVFPSHGNAGDEFGNAVALFEDTLVVGSSKNDQNGSSSGCAYVYKRVGGDWLEQAVLTPADAAQSDFFGTSVSISGNTILVGANYGGVGGAAYVFAEEGGLWLQQAKLVPQGITDGDLFGSSVTLSGDVAVIGAPGYGRNGARSHGIAYVFVRADGAWVQDTILYGSNWVSYDYFGGAVAIDGDQVASGATGASAGGGVYFYDIGVPPVTVDFELSGLGQRLGGGELSQLVKLNRPATAPEFKVTDGYMFNEWDRAFSSVTSDMTVTALYADATSSDGDSLWDGWEQKYLGGTGVSDGTADTDGDGESDTEEFESGSDPRDAASSFHVMEQAVSPVEGQVTLRFTTNDDVGSRRYRIWYTDDLTSASWTELPMGSFAPDAGTVTEKTFAAPGSAGAYFFKVEAFIE